jgi:hypothetical protein
VHPPPQCGGTAARLLAEVYDPPPRMVAWELDPRVLDACRLGMGHEEVCGAAGIGNVELGSPLEASAAVPGGFSGIVVDLFQDGKLMPQLVDPAAWRAIRGKLADPDGGRVMAHLGPAEDPGSGGLVPQTLLALNAMAAAFDGGGRGGAGRGGAGRGGALGQGGRGGAGCGTCARPAL